MRGLAERQAGASLTGMLVTVAVIGFIAYTAVKLVPMYMESFNVKASLNSLSEEVKQGAGAGEIRGELMKRLQLNNVSSVRPENVDIKTMGRTRVVSVSYNAQTRFYGNLHLLLTFDESVVLAER
ncbi:MAG: DUF4845 domain-containing protein [Gammaproteobacteria bacterium]|jgi:hypothetical protein|nr:DUF4845 domain-containing protein [Gammaproteobacteria bacterium]